ncbi:MAG: hypothetical protein C0599_05420 [Salinivirgaceae bacterium]|mgnify:CR=1 FL=1|nr:MAG: hypothetical protein C0599_05420 [Salinivirgaceae bacterium]
MDKAKINEILQKAIPHAIAVILFLIISYAYFSPQLEGKKLESSDVAHFKGTSKELVDYRKQNNEEALWTNRLFGGMPAYLISVKLKNNLFMYVNDILQIGQRPASYVFIALLSFYLALLAFGVNPWLSMTGAIAYAFSSYYFIILGVGHMTKAVAIAYLPGVIAGVYHTYQKKMWVGAAMTALFLGLQLKAFHPQITYYTAIVIIIIGITEFIKALKPLNIVPFLKKSALLAGVALLVLGSDSTKLWMTSEYGDYSIRGKSELTADSENKSKGGLDKDYITAWSYGVDETLTLLIPNILGGSSHGSLDENSKTYELLKQNYGPVQAKKYVKFLPLYFGDQPFTAGPVYFGAGIMLLFIFSLFIIRGRLKWWLLSATILAILLSWGRHFMWFTDLFIDYFPMYDKFRTVSMTLVIAQFTVPLMAIIAIQQLINKEVDKKRIINALKYSLGIMGGIALIFTLFPGIIGDFTSPGDQQLGNQQIINAIVSDRASLVRSDAFRSLIFLLLTAAVVWVYVTEKLKLQYFIAALGVLFIADMWPINKRYINNDNFVRERKVNNPFTANRADNQILQDQSYYRVFNTLARLDQDSRTSYFHNSLGGYHGAKMQRYQELIDYHLSKGNMRVINMLNTKYFIATGQDNKPIAQMNPGAIGNAWFVSKAKIVENADEEIAALNNFDPIEEAIVDKRFADKVSTSYTNDSLASIQLTKYDPKRMVYKAKTNTKQLGVFSEIYYPKGWHAYIDNQPVEHIRVNYVLRALEIPEGEHEIVFEFKPKSYYTGRQIAMGSSFALLIFIIATFTIEIRNTFFKEHKE